MGALGRRGRVVQAGVGDSGRAWIAGRGIDVVSLRGGPLASGDLVRVVVDGPEPMVVEVASGGARTPLLVGPGPLRAARA